VTQRPLYEGSPHSALGGNSKGDDHPQYTSKALSALLMGPFVSAADPRWGVVPGLGDMTARFMRLATDPSIPAGSTVIFQPGTYIFSGSLLWARQLNIYAYGAIFSFGTTNLSAAGYALRIGANTSVEADRTSQLSFSGFTVTRTYGTTIASLLYAGIDWCALLECNVDSVEAVGFEQGHFIHGAVGITGGNVHNNYNNLKVFDCRYGIDIVDGGAVDPVGHSNENNYLGGRMHLSTTITDALSGYNFTGVTSIAAGGGGYVVGDTIDLAGGTFSTRAQIQVTGVLAGAVTSAIVTIPGVYTVLPSNPVAQFSTSGIGSLATFNMAQAAPGNCHAIRIRYLGAHAPNNNRFYGVSLERAWGRKIYCEGLDNLFIGCRYENQNGICDIEFYDPASAGQFGSRNTILAGYQLENAIVKPDFGNGTNFDGSGRSVNLNKILRSDAWLIRGGAAGTTDGAVQVSNSTDTDDAIQAIGDSIRKSIGLMAENGTTHNGALVFRDPTTGAVIYKLRALLGSPNIIVVTDSTDMDVGAMFLSGFDFVLQNRRATTSTAGVTDKGVVEIIGGKAFVGAGDELIPALRVRNSQTSSHLAALITTAGKAMRISFIAEVGGGVVGAIPFYTGALGAELERSRLDMTSGSPYWFRMTNGLILNLGATNSVALRLTPGAGDPGGLTDGDLWYNSGTGKFRKREGGVTSNLDTTGAGLADADYGDITVSGGATVMTIDNDVVTYAKMQNVSATDMVLGRSTAGAGDVEEIACTAAGRALLDDATAADQRTTLGIGSANVQTCYKSSDQAAIGTAFADVTSLTFTINASTAYAFEFHMLMESDAVGTGIDVSVNGPATPDDIQFEIVYWTTANARTERHGNTYDFDTANTASNGTAARWYLVRGVIRNGTTGGSLTARAKREAVGSGPTCKAGSYGILYKLN